MIYQVLLNIFPDCCHFQFMNHFEYLSIIDFVKMLNHLCLFKLIEELIIFSALLLSVAHKFSNCWILWYLNDLLNMVIHFHLKNMTHLRWSNPLLISGHPTFIAMKQFDERNSINYIMLIAQFVKFTETREFWSYIFMGLIFSLCQCCKLCIFQVQFEETIIHWVSQKSVLLKTHKRVVNRNSLNNRMRLYEWFFDCILRYRIGSPSWKMITHTFIWILNHIRFLIC